MFNIEHTPRTSNYPIAPYLSIDPLGFPMLDEDGFLRPAAGVGACLLAWQLAMGCLGRGYPPFTSQIPFFIYSVGPVKKDRLKLKHVPR